MNKVFKRYIVICLALSILVMPNISLCEEKKDIIKDDLSDLENEERRILEKLNILKTNQNANTQDVDKEASNLLKNTNEKLKNVEVKKVDTPTPTPKNTNTLKPTTVPTKKQENQKYLPVTSIAPTAKPTPLIKQNVCESKEKELAQAYSKINELSKELENKKRQLILVETEVERLSEVIERRNRAELGLKRNEQANSNNSSKQSPVVIKRYNSEPETNFTDMPVAIVVVNKANLRAGPSFKDSPLLEVSKGTRLVVETRQGSWYRVMAPNGKRAWVSSDVVNFGPTSNANPSYTTRIKGYSQDAEDNLR